MTRFSRRAGWLAQLFTPSVIPTTSFPERVSEDVSLVQPYDGGGFGFEDPATTAVVVASAVGAATTTSILTVPADSIYRILAISLAVIAGGNPTFACPWIVSPGSASSVALHEGITTADANIRGFTPLTCSVLQAGYILQGRVAGGNAATQVDWRVYGLTLPVGASPTI